MKRPYTTCPDCGFNHLGGDECTRCLMAAQSEARRAARRARWEAEQAERDARPALSIDELWAALGQTKPGGK